MQAVDDRNGENQLSEVEGGRKKIRSINLVMLLRLEIGLKLARLSSSIPAFLINGVTDAALNIEGKTP
jgi:hypothetical protein